MRRRTGRHGVGRSSVIPATLDDMTSTGLRAGEEMDRATWRKKILIPGTLHGKSWGKKDGSMMFATSSCGGSTNGNVSFQLAVLAGNSSVMYRFFLEI